MLNILFACFLDMHVIVYNLTLVRIIDILTVCQLSGLLDQWQHNAEHITLINTYGFGLFAHNDILFNANRALISTLVDKWRSETNSFHFTFVKLTITLEDVHMMSGLPIHGIPVLEEAVQGKSYLLTSLYISCTI